jgi:hypothetical protein
VPKFESHRVLFIHIPKTAGSSIEKVFLNRVGGKSGIIKQALIGRYTDGWQEDFDLPYGGARQHLTYSELKKIGLLSKAMEEEWTKFSFVRDPWNRFMSATFHELNRESARPRRDVLHKCRTADAVRHVIKAFAYTPYRVLAFGFSFDDLMKYSDHFRPQVGHVTHNGEIAMDFIGRFERLNEDFNQFLLQFGLNKKFCDSSGVAFRYDFSVAPNFEIPLERPGTGDKNQTIAYEADFKEHFADMGIHSYKDMYDDELRSFIHEKYKEDIETFNYSFDA